MEIKKLETKKHLLTLEVNDENYLYLRDNYKVLKHEIISLDFLDRLTYVSQAHYGISKKDILSKSRRRETIDVLKVIVYILRRRGLMTYEDIGAKINRHHSTVIHLYNCFLDLKDIDRGIREKYNVLKDVLD